MHIDLGLQNNGEIIVHHYNNIVSPMQLHYCNFYNILQVIWVSTLGDLGHKNYLGMLIVSIIAPMQ